MAGKADKNLPYDLENMSIPELEALLRQDFLASDDSAPDVDYIMEIVEVIHKKEQARPGYQPLDTEKAWEEFQSFYSTEEGREYSIYRSDEEDIPEFKAAKPSSKHKKFKTLHRLLLAAASICLLVALTCIPVLGYHNIFQMLASWTAEQFGFYMPPKESSDPTQVPEELEELQGIMQELGAELIVPRFPEGYEARNAMLSYFPDNRTLKSSIMYQRENDYYIFSVNRDATKSSNQYEKSDSLVETKLYNGIKHYYLENDENNAVAWYDGTIEYYILTNKSISDLKEVIESTYNE